MDKKTALFIIKQQIKNEIQRVDEVYSKSLDRELTLKCCRESGELWRLLKNIEEFEDKYTKKNFENESFTDLEKIRLKIVKEKIQNGIDEFKLNTGQQWTELRLEKPLLETLLNLIEKEN